MRHFFVLILLSFISIRDIKTRSIDFLSPFFLMLLAGPVRSHLLSLLSALSFTLAVELINLICSDLSGIGGGDIRLIFSMTYCVGVSSMLYVILTAGILFLIWALAAAVSEKISFFKIKTALGPFLCLAFYPALVGLY